MGRRHAIIDVVDDVLLINRKNIFGIKSHQWPRDELGSIAVGPSGIEVNEVPVLELKVRPRQGRRVFRTMVTLWPARSKTLCHVTGR